MCRPWLYFYKVYMWDLPDMAGKSHYFHLGVFPWPADGNGADGITGNVVTVITGRMEQWPSGPAEYHPYIP